MTIASDSDYVKALRACHQYAVAQAGAEGAPPRRAAQMREDASTIQRMVNAGGTEHFDEEGTAERARGMDAKDEEPKPAAKPAADDKPAPAAAAQTPDPARKVPPAPGTKRMTISRSSVPKQVDPKRGKPAAKSAPKVKAKAPAKPKDKAKKKSR